MMAQFSLLFEAELHAYFESFVNKLHLRCIIFLFKTENYMGSPKVKVHLMCAALKWLLFCCTQKN